MLLGRGLFDLRDTHLFVQGLLTGICGAFITADIFNLYVWFEVLLIGSTPVPARAA